MNSLSSNQAVDARTPIDETRQIVPQETTVCVVGLGYVGLPLAVRFDETGYDVVGYDIDADTVAQLSQGTDTTGDLGDETVKSGDVAFTTDPATLSNAGYVLLTVPTPLDQNNRPSVEFVKSAAETVGQHMTPDTTVILESTVYPGATQEVLVPALEDASGLECGEEFSVGYSPERANPGDEEHGLRNVVKIVSGQNSTVRADVAELYEHVIDAGVHRAPTMEAAEAAKVVENVQRDVNIALVNELAMVFDDLEIDTQAVLAAAGTKWNFHDYGPGLVSGHCIPVDPHFLLHSAQAEGSVANLIRTSREVNEEMPAHVADQMVKALSEAGRPLADSCVLVAGLTYKPDVPDIRNSKVAAVLDTLREYGIDLVGYDPQVPNETLTEQFDIPALDSLSFEEFDGLLLATPHEEFRGLNPAAVADQLIAPPAIVDVYGTFESSQLPADAIYRGI
ncbi:nucleotide sugar dehydrogenase [Halorientalis salina]|uniref:nucleotide sugar dehydrogenase n=1 Tax=Halorientalis salina TaxID=2932266 RepID=UPI0010ACA840|nr:nucleotide sugar dehydrogenase [Halorientalis salina]